MHTFLIYTIMLNSTLYSSYKVLLFLSNYFLMIQLIIYIFVQNPLIASNTCTGTFISTKKYLKLFPHKLAPFNKTLYYLNLLTLLLWTTSKELKKKSA